MIELALSHRECQHRQPPLGAVSNRGSRLPAGAGPARPLIDAASSGTGTPGTPPSRRSAPTAPPTPASPRGAGAATRSPSERSAPTAPPAPASLRSAGRSGPRLAALDGRLAGAHLRG